MEDVKKAWEAFEQQNFPIGHRGISVDGQSLTMIQSELGGYIVSFLVTNGSLGARQRDALQLTIDRIERAKPEMTDEGKEHFETLIAIGKMVLQQAHDQPTM